MRIVARLRLLVVLAIIGLVLLGGLLASSLKTFRQASNNSVLATSMAGQLSSAVSLSSDYFLFRNERSQRQWRDGHDLTRLSAPAARGERRFSERPPRLIVKAWEV